MHMDCLCIWFCRDLNRKRHPHGAVVFCSNVDKAKCTNNLYAPMLPPCFLKPFLVLVHTLAALDQAQASFQHLLPQFLWSVLLLFFICLLVGAAKVCTNSKRGLKKQRGSIGAYGLLVHMVLARFKRKQQPPTGRSVFFVLFISQKPYAATIHMHQCFLFFF